MTLFKVKVDCLESLVALEELNLIRRGRCQLGRVGKALIKNFNCAIISLTKKLEFEQSF